MEGEYDQASLVSRHSHCASSNTIDKLVLRLRALTLQLLPVEVSTSVLKDPTSHVITAQVVHAYAAAAGDFLEALPFALLRTRHTFVKDASTSISDWDENMSRAVACEVLARRIVHQIDPSRLQSVMSTRYRYREANGDVSTPSSVLEYAVDQDSVIFLSSNECQLAMDSLWDGRWVQKYNDHDDIDYVPFDEVREGGFWGHLDPSRLSVPKYQNILRIVIWFFFLLAYSQAVRQPIEGKRTNKQSLDGWEYALYIMSFSFASEEFHKIYKNIRLFTWRAGIASFWTIISIITMSLLTAAFVYRLIGIFGNDPNGQTHILSFQILSCVAPFIWMRLITIFDGMKYIGTMQICVGSMLRESTIFFALLALLFAGFLQAMVALDASDGQYDRGAAVVNTLIQALLQSPDFDKPSNTNFGLVLFYLWNFTTSIILLNVLISLFASAYDSVTDDAEAEYLAFFAGKTIAMIRAPDEYVYLPPFNFIEIFLVAPFEPILSRERYAKLNKYIMLVVFFIPLTVIALYESRDKKSSYFRDWFERANGEIDNSDEAKNPEVDDEDGRQISKVQFEDLIKVFPNTSMSSDERVLRDIRELKEKLEAFTAKLDR
ncbi:hypothetical protein M422DRAFT_23093 [Sphaerobolus stellatus SS14]|nr:hypothetical protein M422DRAFT_23093 [Sphaerobolus stellatus SS14]